MKKGNLKDLKWQDRFTYIKDVPFTAEDLQCKGAKFQIVMFKPKTSIKPHFHKKTYEIFYVQSGNGMLKLNDEEFRCKPNDFFLCEPGDVHEFLNDTEENFTILIFKTNEVEDEDIFWKK